VPGRVNGFSLAYTAAGAVVLWSGIQGWSISATFKALLSGTTPASSTEQINTTAVEQSEAASSTGGSSGGTVLQGGAAGGTAKANQAIAKLLAAPYGWSTGTQWDDLVSLWTRESGWNNKADNPTSGAYGIPQSLPATKMPKSARPPSEGGSSNATAQISWGLAYIKDTYGSPSAAWAHEESAGWY
jgi:hypothetical protein